MSANRYTVSEVIARLQENYKPSDIIAVNWWSAEDFEQYSDIEKALELAQQFLDHINPELTDYVFIELGEESKWDRKIHDDTDCECSNEKEASNA
jgi:hypothetical protein